MSALYYFYSEKIVSDAFFFECEIIANAVKNIYDYFEGATAPEK